MSRSRGFTLVELLVVIAIIGMLMGLLFPAINAARESARATTCRNNLRELGQALVQYAEAKHRYPGIWTYNRNRLNLWYWRPLLYEITPQLQRGDLYERFRRDDYMQSGIPAFYIEMMVCPSDPQAEDGAPTSYVYNFGYGGRATYNRANGVFNWDNGGVKSPFQYADWKSVSPNYIADVDGADSTLLCSENIDAGDWTDVSWFQAGLCWLDVSPSDQHNYRINANRGQSLNQRNDDDRWEFLRPSSNHPQQVHAVFASGRVASLNEDMDYLVYAAMLSSRNSMATNGETGQRPTNVTVHTHVLNE